MTCFGCGLHLDMLRLLLCLGLAGLAAGPLAAQPADSPNIVTGAVVDDRGAPAADIEVVLRPHPSAFEADLYVLGHSDALPQAVDRTRSDVDGVFSLSPPAAGPYRLEFGRSRPPTDSVPAMPLVQGVIVPLKGSRVAETVDVPDRHPIAVRVLDSYDQPIAGALVVANPAVLTPPRTAAAMTRMARDMSAGNYSRPAEQHLFPTYHPSAARTDAEGIARFVMPNADATVLVSATGFVLGKGATRAGRLALRLEANPGIRLRVRGPTGAPVPGAVVRTATARDRRVNAGTPTARRTISTPAALGGFDTPLAITDENGEAIIGPTPGIETALEVEAADGGFAQVSLPAANPAESPDRHHIIDVRLEEPLRIPGRIVDAASGLPIHNAAIWVHLFPGHHAFSDPTGAFDLSTRPASRATRLQATATGFLPERVDISAADLSNREEVRIGLTPSAPLRGLVTDEAGQPVAGASIRAEPRGDGVRSRFSLSSRPATSGSDGFFRVAEALYGHAYRLTAQAAGYATSALDLPPLEPGMAVDPVHLVLSKGRRVLGSVVDSDGNPVAEAEVSLLWPLDPSEFRSGFETPAGAAATDGRGVFVLPDTGPGGYEILVGHADYAHRPPSQVEVPAGESDFDLGDFTLAAGGAVHGIVRDPDGEPVGGATIQAHERDRFESPVRTATTDADGRFRLVGFSSDLADLGVQASGYPVHIEPDVRVDRDDPVVIELQPGASIDGRVLDHGGNGVSGVSVRLRIEFDFSRRSDPRLWDAVDGFPSRVTDQHGRFRFNGLAAGTWSAEASRGAEGAKLDGIELIPGGGREIELPLRTRDRLIVTVVTEVGEPVADARIRVETPGERFPTGSGRTDGSGRDVIDIDPGPATVQVSHTTLRDESRQVRLDPGDNEVRFQLRPGVELSGTVRSYDGAPLALATVEAETEYAFGVESHDTNTVSDHNGAFRLTGLETRRYNLTARSPGYADGGPDEPIEIGDATVEGIEIVLEPETSIVGVVTGLSPSDLNQVEVSAWNWPRHRDATRGTDGNFSIQGIGPGTWEVTAIKGEWERTVERTVTIKRGMTEVFVELPFERGLRLSGRVVEDGAPLGGANLWVGDASARADREGRFALEGLDPGPNQVTISRPDFSGLQYQSIDLQTDLEDVRFELEPTAATVAGVVVDAETGQPVDYARLMAADAATIGAIAAGDRSGGPLVGVSYVLTQGAGHFKLELRENADHLWVSLDGYEGAQIPLNISPGEHREGLVIRLQPAPAESPNQ
ncbi:MAG: carboxypeptidase regulatory-like domain-containing protein [Acidobacteria bacterium]|nr:carboxypeptidase regulatory-like domain-containing protein [Acidobacteriota bacterium]